MQELGWGKFPQQQSWGWRHKLGLDLIRSGVRELKTNKRLKWRDLRDKLPHDEYLHPFWTEGSPSSPRDMRFLLTDLRFFIWQFANIQSLGWPFYTKGVTPTHELEFIVANWVDELTYISMAIRLVNSERMSFASRVKRARDAQAHVLRCPALVFLWKLPHDFCPRYEDSPVLNFFVKRKKRDFEVERERPSSSLTVTKNPFEGYCLTQNTGGSRFIRMCEQFPSAKFKVLYKLISYICLQC